MGEVIAWPKLEHRAVCPDCHSDAWAVLLDGTAETWRHIIGFSCSVCDKRMIFGDDEA